MEGKTSSNQKSTSKPDGSQHQKQKISHGMNKRRKSFNEDISGITEQSNMNDYFKQLQKILNDQSVTSGSNIQQILGGLAEDVEDAIDLDARFLKDDTVDAQKYGSDENNKQARGRLFKPSVQSIQGHLGSISSNNNSNNQAQIVNQDFIEDASKRSTSPPSSSIRSSSKPILANDQQMQTVDLSQKIHQLITCSLNQQQLLLKLMEETHSNSDRQIGNTISQLQQLQVSHQEQLVSLEKLYQQKQVDYDTTKRQMNELNFQRFKIKSELENSQEQGSLNREIKGFFGSTQNFIQAFKSDTLLVYNFIKYEHARLNQLQSSQQAALQNPKILSQTFSQQKQETSYPLLKRKQSDPLFDNEDFLKQIEDKYLQQFEQQLLQESQVQEINTSNLRSSKEGKLALLNNNQSRRDEKQDKNHQKKRRMNSEDKYDKKDFQERMEKQFMQMIKQQFPVSSSGSEEDEEEDTDRGEKNRGKGKQGASGQKEKKKTINKEKGENSSNQEKQSQISEGQPPNKPKQQSETKSNHRKNRSSRLLHIDMPEDMIINMLSDSKDMLEDPNAQTNYFEIDSIDTSLQHTSGVHNNHQNSVGIETPAFGKRKAPSLALFKGQPGTNSEQQLIGNSSGSSNSQTKKKRQSKQNPDLNLGNSQTKSSDRGQQPQPFAYDNWKSEVKKVFQKKKTTEQKQQTQNINTKQASIVNMQTSMSPLGKSKSPTSHTHQSRNHQVSKLDSLQSTGGLKDRINKTQGMTSLTSQSSQQQQNFSSSQHSSEHNAFTSQQQMQQHQLPQSTRQKNVVSKSPNSKSSMITSSFNQTLKSQKSIGGGMKTGRAEEIKKNVSLLSTVQVNINSSGGVSASSLMSSRNAKHGSLSKVHSYQQQQPSTGLIDLGQINKMQPLDGNIVLAKDLQIDVKSIDQIGQTISQSQQLYSGRITGGVGRLPIQGSNYPGSSQAKSRNNNIGSSKSPSLR